MQALEWLRRGRAHEAGSPAARVPHNPTESRPRRIVLWALVCWTALSGLAMVVAQSDFSQMAAAGLKDSAGQRLLGVQLLLLAVVYALAARQPGPDGRGRVPGWLPLAGQAATAVVILSDTVARNVHVGSSWPALCVALLFALLLSAFLLAGEPAFHGHEDHLDETASWPVPAAPVEAPTQRIDRAPHQPATAHEVGGEAAPPTSGKTASDAINDERVLGA